jgi:hypothetical protein
VKYPRTIFRNYFTKSITVRWEIPWGEVICKNRSDVVRSGPFCWYFTVLGQGKELVSRGEIKPFLSYAQLVGLSSYPSLSGANLCEGPKSKRFNLPVPTNPLALSRGRSQGDAPGNGRGIKSSSYLFSQDVIFLIVQRKKRFNLPVPTNTVVVHQSSSQPSPYYALLTDSPPSLRVGFATRIIEFNIGPARRSWLGIPTLVEIVNRDKRQTSCA